MRTNVKKFAGRMLGSNTYLLYQDSKCVIIDPCVKPETTEDFIKNNKLDVKGILITHSHVDHIMYINEYRDIYGVKAAVHELDFNAISDNGMNGSELFGFRKSFREAEIKIKGGETLVYGPMEISVIHTPGHTPGSVCFYIDDMVFTGDTLFYLSIGRTDLGRGDIDEIMDSIGNKLMKLPEKTIVYPGHGTFTTIEYEKNNNQFIVE